MKRLLVIGLAGGALVGAGALAQTYMDRFTDTNPRVDASVRTSDGETIGTVERVRFETPARAIIDGYVIEYGGTLEVGGREVLVEEDRTSWTGLPLSPVLELDYTREELEALPDFDEDLATSYPLADNEWFVGEDEEQAARRRARETGDEAPANGPRDVVPEDILSEEAQRENIVWDTTFNPDLFTRENWMDQEVFTTNGEELGIIVDVRPEQGQPSAIVVRTFPDFHDLGETIELDIAQVTGIAEEERAVRANFTVVRRDESDIVGNGPER